MNYEGHNIYVVNETNETISIMYDGKIYPISKNWHCAWQSIDDRRCSGKCGDRMVAWENIGFDCADGIAISNGIDYAQIQNQEGKWVESEAHTQDVLIYHFPTLREIFNSNELLDNALYYEKDINNDNYNLDEIFSLGNGKLVITTFFEGFFFGGTFKKMEVITNTSFLSNLSTLFPSYKDVTYDLEYCDNDWCCVGSETFNTLGQVCKAYYKYEDSKKDKDDATHYRIMRNCDSEELLNNDDYMANIDKGLVPIIKVSAETNWRIGKAQYGCIYKIPLELDEMGTEVYFNGDGIAFDKSLDGHFYKCYYPTPNQLRHSAIELEQILSNLTTDSRKTFLEWLVSDSDDCNFYTEDIVQMLFEWLSPYKERIEPTYEWKEAKKEVPTILTTYARSLFFTAPTPIKAIECSPCGIQESAVEVNRKRLEDFNIIARYIYPTILRNHYGAQYACDSKPYLDDIMHCNTIEKFFEHLVKTYYYDDSFSMEQADTYCEEYIAVD